ncbi:hypothetical protein ABE52_19415 [Bacillus thuringiensis]|nr:hypothetical protein [Bacillus thuringiensis]
MLIGRCSDFIKKILNRFLNETAASIIKMHIDGITLEEIKNKLMNEYAIPDKDIKNFENQVESTISNFENTLNNGE